MEINEQKKVLDNVMNLLVGLNSGIAKSILQSAIYQVENFSTVQSEA